MSALNAVYDRLPSSLQGWAVTTKGFLNRRTRYGSEFDKIFPDMLRQQWASEEFWKSLQYDRLRSIVRDARANVPYYASVIDTESLRAPTLDQLLAELPLLPKHTLRENPGEFRHSNMDKMRTVNFSTSGTTGAPLTITHSVEAFSTIWAAMVRFWRIAGIDRGDRRLSFTGNRIVTEGGGRGPFGRYDRVNNRLLMSSYHLGTKTVDRYLDEIERFRPAFIDGYPSAISFCARNAQTSGRSIPITACFPTAETLFADQRKVIETGFQTRVYNQYGSAEGVALITECPSGRLHVNPEVGVVEVLNADGSKTAPGEIGDMVLTTLSNRAMPLLRYQIGDRAVAVDASDRCPCGRNMPLIGDIVGRQDDVVITSDGRRIGMLSYNVFKWTKGIKESQIIQKTPAHFEIRIVPGPGFDSEQSEVAVRALKERVGEDVSVSVTTVDRLERSANGKLRAVISEVVNDIA